MIGLGTIINTAAVLAGGLLGLLLKKLTPQRKARLLEASAQASVNLLPAASGKTRKKAWILAHCFAAVLPLACLRELYLLIKK